MKPPEAIAANGRTLVRQMPRLFGLFAGPSALKAAEAGLGIVVSALLVRTMSVAEFGRFSFIFSMIRIFTLPARLGVGNLLVKEIAREVALENFGRIHGTVRWAWRFAAGWAIPATAAVVIAYRSSRIAGDSTFWLASGVCCLAFCAIGPVSGAFRGIKRPALSMLAESFIAPVALVATLALLLAAGWRIGVGAALALRGGFLLASGILTYLALQRLSQWRQMPRTQGEASGASLSRLVVPFTLVGSVLLLNQQAGLTLAGFLFDAETVALYRGAEQVAVVLTIIPTIVNTVAMPYIAESAQLGRVSQTRQLIRRSMAGSLALSAALLLVVVVFGQALLTRIYGPDFGGGYTILVVLSAAWGLNGGTAFNIAYLNMSGSQKPLVAIVVFCAALQLMLGVALGLTLGVLGVALASAFAIVLNGALVIRRTNLELDSRQVDA
jgi:O-antigen/teichoic acid export membrane protein